MFASKFLAEGIMLIFPDNAEMAEIKEYSYLVKQSAVLGQIEIGDQVRIGEHNFTITDLGEIVQKNLVELSHITLKFGLPTTSVMPGTIYLESKEIPQIEKGTMLSILKK
jgi:PTS system glucitol/sorbitol-specific IIA component